jgi:hypothetical protein
MILDNIINMGEDILEIVEQCDPDYNYDDGPIIITFDYYGVPLTFTLLIHEKLPEGVDYFSEDIVH